MAGYKGPILDIHDFAETVIAVETQLRQKIKELDR